MEGAENVEGAAPEPEGAAPEQPQQPETPNLAERIGTAIGVVVLIALVVAVFAGVVWALGETFPDDVKEKPDAGFLDQIFASRAVLWAARVMMLSAGIVLFFGGIYVVVSIVSWLRRGHLLEQAGPFRVSTQAVKAVEEAEQQIVELQQELMQAWTDNDALEQRLAEREGEIDDFIERVNQAFSDEGGEPTS